MKDQITNSNYSKVLDVDGIKVLYNYNTTNKIYMLRPTFTAGALIENDQNCGVTHFLEHLLFYKSKNYTKEQFAKIKQDLFPRYNASTSGRRMDMMCKSQMKNLEDGFKYSAEAILNFDIDDEKINTERYVIEQEFIMYDDDDYYKSVDIAEKNMCKHSYFQNGTIGTRESILSLTKQDLLDKYNELACKENFLLAFSGPASEEEVIRLTKKYYSPLKNSKKLSIPTNLKFNNNTTVEFLKNDKDKCSVTLLLPINENADTSLYASVLRNVFTNNFLSQNCDLWNKLRKENGLVYSYFATLNNTSNLTLIPFRFETSRQNIKECLSIFASILNNLLENGLTDEQFQSAKNAHEFYLDSLILSSSTSVSLNIASYLNYDQLYSLDKEMEILNNLTATTFNQELSKLKPKSCHLAVVGNVEKEDLPTTEELNSMFNITQ